jgi:hypothetical protein
MSLHNRLVVLIFLTTTFLFCSCEKKQPRTTRGTVVSKRGNGIPSATITIGIFKGKSSPDHDIARAVSWFNGTYEMNYEVKSGSYQFMVSSDSGSTHSDIYNLSTLPAVQDFIIQ